MLTYVCPITAEQTDDRCKPSAKADKQGLACIFGTPGCTRAHVPSLDYRTAVEDCRITCDSCRQVHRIYFGRGHVDVHPLKPDGVPFICPVRSVPAITSRSGEFECPACGGTHTLDGERVA